MSFQLFPDFFRIQIGSSSRVSDLATAQGINDGECQRPDSITMATITRRRVEIIAFEQERITRRLASQSCPECQQANERHRDSLTLPVRSKARRVYHWLAILIRRTGLT